MAESTGSASIEEGKRKSYTREFKLGVLHFYKSSGTNLYKTAKNFSLNTKNVRRWIKDEQKLRELRRARQPKRSRVLCIQKWKQSSMMITRC